MKRHEQARLYLRKAAEDETLLDEVIASPRVSMRLSASIASRRLQNS